MNQVTLVSKDTPSHTLPSRPCVVEVSTAPQAQSCTYTFPYSISVMVMVLTCQASSLLGMNRSSLARWPTQREAMSPKKMLSNSNVSVLPLQTTKTSSVSCPGLMRQANA